MIKNKISLVVLSIGLLLPLLAQGQESNLGNWLIYIGNKKVNTKWNIHNEVQYRNYNAIGDLEQLLLRTGAGYSFNDGQSNILLGYGYIHSENYVGGTGEKESINEHRVFQQFTTKQQIGKVKLNHRYRFEQRIVEGDFKMRLRYFVAVNVPLTTQGRIYLSAYNEIFLNTASKVFDRNRLYGGIGYKLNDNVRFELGYMNQFFEISGRDQLNIISFVNF